MPCDVSELVFDVYAQSSSQIRHDTTDTALAVNHNYKIVRVTHRGSETLYIEK